MRYTGSYDHSLSGREVPVRIGNLIINFLVI